MGGKHMQFRIAKTDFELPLSSHWKTPQILKLSTRVTGHSNGRADLERKSRVR